MILLQYYYMDTISFLSYYINIVINLLNSTIVYQIWEARPFGGGHCGRVSDLVWSRGGKYLLSTSSDNTTRMHARYGKMNEVCSMCT